MRGYKILIFLAIISLSSISRAAKDEDFSEFDDFDQDEFVIDTPSATGPTPSPPKAQTPKPPATSQQDIVEPDSSETKDEEATIDDDDEESMFDEEEFESSDSFPSSSNPAATDLKFTEVPASLTGNHWEAYFCEGIMILTLLIYLINFIVGRTKNSSLATAIYRSQRDILTNNFHVIGNNGQTRESETEEDANPLQKESENLYILWCTGRVSLESMLVEFRFVKRQCIFNSIAAVIKSINDTIVYTIDFGKDDMDTFVFCLARKRCAARLHREMIDLSQFCERKNAEKKGLGGNYQILSELGDVSSVFVDGRVGDFIDKYPDAIEYIHISDQYQGTKNQQTDQQTSSSSTTGGTASQQQDAVNASERTIRHVLIVAFNLVPQQGRSLQVTCETLSSDYLRFVLGLADRVAGFRITSKESKNKAIKNRQRIEEAFLKNVNLQRQELAQQRREEQRRADKEKVMNSDDPELQRKWEKLEQKRELKRQRPKMKQMKIKSM